MVKKPVNLLFPTKSEIKSQCKGKRLIPFPNSHGLSLKCSCNTKVNSFTHASKPVICPNCSKPLLLPRGGKAKLLAAIDKKSLFGLEPVY
ncbi:MAG: 40S ribosomal protein S27 [Paramarteilia canceri]